MPSSPAWPWALSLVLLAAADSLAQPAPPAAPAPLRTVERVDLDRYLGTWHEIARYPFRIQEQCARDTVAVYSARDDGAIGVLNRCLRADGSVFAAEGVAQVIDTQSKARLQVSFLPAWLRWLPVGRGDYWVIDLAPDYRYAVIGEPQRRYLWILARTPQLDAQTFRGITERLAAQGYDPARLVPSPGLALPR
jgi:apolipoprotein D and lipocalin family protein